MYEHSSFTESGGSTTIHGLDGSYLSHAGLPIRDRVNLIYTDLPAAGQGGVRRSPGLAPDGVCLIRADLGLSMVSRGGSIFHWR